MAKTLACRSLAAALDGEFKRIQFTPDLLPSDIVGTRIFDQRESAFATVLGPIFANVVLADEINRAPAKVQSALLEAMQERQVTIGPQSYALPDPFVVMATMNPARLRRHLRAADRADGPLPDEDQRRLSVARRRTAHSRPLCRRRYAAAALGGDSRRRARPGATRRMRCTLTTSSSAISSSSSPSRAMPARSPSGEVAARRCAPTDFIDYGASPRATLALAFLARGRAMLAGPRLRAPRRRARGCEHALCHRIGFNYRLATEGVSADAIIQAMIAAIPAP